MKTLLSIKTAEHSAYILLVASLLWFGFESIGIFFGSPFIVFSLWACLISAIALVMAMFLDFALGSD